MVVENLMMQLKIAHFSAHLNHLNESFSACFWLLPWVLSLYTQKEIRISKHKSIVIYICASEVSPSLSCSVILILRFVIGKQYISYCGSRDFHSPQKASFSYCLVPFPAMIESTKSLWSIYSACHKALKQMMHHFNLISYPYSVTYRTTYYLSLS